MAMTAAACVGEGPRANPPHGLALEPAPTGPAALGLFVCDMFPSGVNQVFFQWGDLAQSERTVMHAMGGQDLYAYKKNQFGEWQPPMVEVWYFGESAPDAEELTWFGLERANATEIVANYERRQFVMRAASNLVMAASDRDILDQAQRKLAAARLPASALSQLAMEMGVDWSADAVVLRDCRRSDASPETASKVGRYKAELRLGRTATLALTVEGQSGASPWEAGEEVCNASGLAKMLSRDLSVTNGRYCIVVDLESAEQQSSEVDRVLRWLWLGSDN